MGEQSELLEKLILGEVEGKNRAIHAYDGMVWKIRTGFLTLLFGGWAILLTGIVEGSSGDPAGYRSLVWGLYLFSLGFALAAWYVGRNYVRRKFRVISALDRLTVAIRDAAGDPLSIPPDLLKVAGDNAEKPFDGPGYREAVAVDGIVYLAPLLILLAVIGLVLY